MKKPLALLVLAFTLAACSSEPQPAPFQVDYSNLGKIGLAVHGIVFADRSGGNLSQGSYIEGQFHPTIVDAVQRWESDRLAATGASGEANFIVKEASLTNEPLQMESGIGSWFERQQGTKFSAHVAVEIDAKDGSTYALATAEASRFVTLPEDPSPVEKQAAYHQLLDALMSDLNQNLDRSIHEHMGSFVTGAAR